MNNLQPILCDTDSSEQIDAEDVETMHHQIFSRDRQNYMDIPDFSEHFTSVQNNDDRDDYHCVLNKQNRNVQVCRPETIDNIIKKLDMTMNENTDNDTEYITHDKVSSLIGDMRVDILSLVKLVVSLNKSVTSENEESQNIKRDVCKLVNENIRLREKITKQKEETDRRYDHMCQTYDRKLNLLFSKLKLNDDQNCDNNNCDNKNNDEIPEHNIRVVRKSQHVTSVENTKTPSNIFNDSQMDKKTSKFKVVPVRTKKTGGDNFGRNNEPEDNEIVFTSVTRHALRRDQHDNGKKEKEIADTRQSRVSRFGLHNSTMSNKM